MNNQNLIALKLSKALNLSEFTIECLKIVLLSAQNVPTISKLHYMIGKVDWECCPENVIKVHIINI